MAHRFVERLSGTAYQHMAGQSSMMMGVVPENGRILAQHASSRHNGFRIGSNIAIPLDDLLGHLRQTLASHLGRGEQRIEHLTRPRYEGR